MTWLVALGLLIVGAVMLATCWWGSQGRLPRNRIIGIRIPATMRSDAAWDAGHRAAAGPTGIGGGIAVLAALGVVAAGLDLIGWVIAAIGLVAVLASAAVATVAASRAAKDLPAA